MAFRDRYRQIKKIKTDFSENFPIAPPFLIEPANFDRIQAGCLGFSDQIP